MRTLLSLAATIGLLSLSATPAFAAKGVKKEVDGLHHVHGVVVHVEHSNGGKGKKAKGKDHLGEITIKVTHHKKKGTAAAAKPAVAKPAVAGKAGKKKHEDKFSVSTHTKFVRVKGKERKMAAFADVKDGEHVTIIEKKGHAEEVLIHEHAGKKKA
jgi:hypothetical protein